MVDSGDARTSSPAWTLPSRIAGRHVMPDDRASSVAFIKASQAANAIGVGLGTSPGESAGGAGKGSVAISTVATSVDPSRMGIWLCLLDDKPHLHPTLAALHKHRHVAHGIPLPTNLSAEPTLNHASQTIHEGDVHMDSNANEAKSGIASPQVEGASDNGAGPRDKPEWLSWRFSVEEEARRKAFLPLA